MGGKVAGLVLAAMFLAAPRAEGQGLTLGQALERFPRQLIGKLEGLNDVGFIALGPHGFGDELLQAAQGQAEILQRTLQTLIGHTV